MSTIKPFLKQQYRSSLGISGDILQVCMNAGIEGILLSKISQRANLSHTATIENSRKLINAGMIKPVKGKRNYIFIITEKGIKFFQEFQKFQDVVKEINIRY
jgi:predicted transcriptional regulator